MRLDAVEQALPDRVTLVGVDDIKVQREKIGRLQLAHGLERKAIRFEESAADIFAGTPGAFRKPLGVIGAADRRRHLRKHTRIVEDRKSVV